MAYGAWGVTLLGILGLELRVHDLEFRVYGLVCKA